MVSGGQLDAFDLNAEDAAKRNYVALAVQRSDGKPIEDYDKPGISVSPLIEGFDQCVGMRQPLTINGRNRL